MNNKEKEMMRILDAIALHVAAMEDTQTIKPEDAEFLKNFVTEGLSLLGVDLELRVLAEIAKQHTTTTPEDIQQRMKEAAEIVAKARKNPVIRYRMTFREAVQNRDAVNCGRYVDVFRSNGMKYDDVFKRVQAIDPTVTLAEWETLMDEADNEKE